MLLPQDKLIVFYDTETTGFPQPGKPLEQNPYIVQLAYIVGMYNGETVDVIESKNIFIDPCVPIPEEVTKIHGIDNERVKGCPTFGEIAGDFFRQVVKADIVVGHNVAFDVQMVHIEAQRIWTDTKKRDAWMRSLNSKLVCTMKPSVDLCKIPFPRGGFGHKWPKLIELHKFLFGREFENAHDALGDITATMDCFVELHRRNVIEIK